MTYCHSCDKHISQKFIKRHNKSKSHLYFHINFVINKYHIGDVFFKDFENIVHEYMIEYNCKFDIFSKIISFEFHNEKKSISIDNTEGEIPL